MRLAWVRGNWSSRGPPPGPGWRNPSPWRTIPPPMSLLAFLLVAQTATQDTVRPYLAFPEPGLDDPAAYEGYATRVYQDASHNAFQVYLKGNTGRVVNLWADAANESVGFTVRDSSGRPAELAWGSAGAVVTGSAHTRSVSYALELPSTVRVGLFLLGSMRVERDLQYAGRDTLPLDAPPFTQAELRRQESSLAGARGRRSGNCSHAFREHRHGPTPGRRPRAPDRARDDRRAGAGAPRARGDLQRGLPALRRAGPRRHRTSADVAPARARSAGRRAAVLPREADGGAAQLRDLFRS